jgi:uncharacterized protein (UPF0218 family)
MQTNARTKHTLILKPELRQELRNPLGTLIKGTPEETEDELRKLIQKERPEHMISVGDIASQALLKLGIKPQIVIVDGKAMRQQIKPIKTETREKITMENPAGTLTPQAWITLDKAIARKRPTLITVEGEEDLLTLVAVMKTPNKWTIVYGQPQEGVVIVKVNATTKHKANLIVQAMEPLPQS